MKTKPAINSRVRLNSEGHALLSKSKTGRRTRDPKLLGTVVGYALGSDRKESRVQVKWDTTDYIEELSATYLEEAAP